MARGLRAHPRAHRGEAAYPCSKKLAGQVQATTSLLAQAVLAYREGSAPQPRGEPWRFLSGRREPPQSLCLRGPSNPRDQLGLPSVSSEVSEVSEPQVSRPSGACCRGPSGWRTCYAPSWRACTPPKAKYPPPCPSVPTPTHPPHPAPPHPPP